MSEPGKIDRSYIRVKAFAVSLNEAGTHHVVLRGIDPAVPDEYFHLLLGGSIELGERSEVAVLREIREELGATLLEPRLLQVVENVFEYDGELGHEVVFLEAGHLAEAGVVPLEGGEFYDNGLPMWVEWRPVDDAELTAPIYPEEVTQLLALGAAGRT